MGNISVKQMTNAAERSVLIHVYSFFNFCQDVMYVYTNRKER